MSTWQIIMREREREPSSIFFLHYRHIPIDDHLELTHLHGPHTCTTYTQFPVSNSLETQNLLGKIVV